VVKSVEIYDREFHNGKALVAIKGAEKDLRESMSSITQLGRKVKPTPSSVLQSELVKRGWKTEHRIPNTDLRLDAYHSSKVGVEIEMTDPMDLLRALIKLQLAYIYDQIDAGVIITYDDSYRGDNIPHKSNVIKWYKTLNMFIDFPLWLVGLAWTPNAATQH
jgi:hypothetical protein